eukprot:364881-Chlamydomonas_euryale.AAC.2
MGHWMDGRIGVLAKIEVLMTTLRTKRWSSEQLRGGEELVRGGGWTDTTLCATGGACAGRRSCAAMYKDCVRLKGGRQASFVCAWREAGRHCLCAPGGRQAGNVCVAPGGRQAAMGNEPQQPHPVELVQVDVLRRHVDLPDDVGHRVWVLLQVHARHAAAGRTDTEEWGGCVLWISEFRLRFGYGWVWGGIKLRRARLLRVHNNSTQRTHRRPVEDRPGDSLSPRWLEIYAEDLGYSCLAAHPPRPLA